MNQLRLPVNIIHGTVKKLEVGMFLLASVDALQKAFCKRFLLSNKMVETFHASGPVLPSWIPRKLSTSEGRDCWTGAS